MRQIVQSKVAAAEKPEARATVVWVCRPLYYITVRDGGSLRTDEGRRGHPSAL